MSTAILASIARLNLTTRPRSVSDRVIDDVCDAMRLCGRDELVHYAGASYRDATAWALVVAWQADPLADRALLLQRAYRASGWGEVPLDSITRTQGITR